MPVPGRNRNRRLLAGVALAAMLASVAAAQAAPAAKHPGAAKPAALPAAGPPTVFASGLNSPRGLNFGPDGDLYVAEAGTGGDTSTADVCPDDQVVPPVGPYTGGDTARITKYAPDGTRTVVADGLPSATEALGDHEGVADVEFLDGQLYALISGAGCSHGHADTPNALLRVNADGSTTQIADLSAFVHAHVTAHPNPGDFEPDGDFYSMAVSGGAFYVVEANQGQVLKVTLDGTVTRVVDWSAKFGHVVPTSIAAWNGHFFVGNLGNFPIVPGSEVVRKLTAGGKLGLVASGLSTVLSIVVDKHGRIYALESMTMPGFPGPDQLGTGTVVRVKSDGTLVPIATGLSFATGMTLGPDQALYVSNLGFGGAPGDGQIMRIALRS